MSDDTIDLHQPHLLIFRRWHDERHLWSGTRVVGSGRQEEVVGRQGDHVVGVVEAIDGLQEGFEVSSHLHQSDRRMRTFVVMRSFKLAKKRIQIWSNV